MLNRLTLISYQLKTNKVRSVRARVNYYAKCPNFFKKKTLIRPPDLKKPNITFPIRIPIRVRHIFHLKRQLWIDNTSKIHWNRLQPNEILLGLEKCQYLDFYELMEGLKYLSEVKGQQNHDWNEHEWVKNAMDMITDNFFRIKKVDMMKVYFMMKTLNYKNQNFWSLMYSKINDYIYDLKARELEHIYLTYYDQIDEVFGSGAKEKFTILMENRLREFSPSGIMKLFKRYYDEKRLDTYWFESVFLTLFREGQYQYDARDLGAIFRYMMIYNIEHDQRLYDSLYKKVMKLKVKNQSEIQQLEEVLQEVKQLFPSHRVEPSLNHLVSERERLIREAMNIQKSLEERVKEDLQFFMEKRKLKLANQITA